MPIYEYRCDECKEDFEALVSFSSGEEVTCPFCGSNNTEKKMPVFTSDTCSG